MGFVLPPVTPPALDDCYFYHCMDVPGHGTVGGEWDLRGRADDYLGNVDISGLRVLEIGTASGFLCFEMERRGAAVIACDLSPEQSWDIVPFAGLDVPAHVESYRRHIGRINNAYWLAHDAFGSRAQVIYSDVYSIPDDIGPVDAAIFGSVLLHVRDPFLALQRALALTRQIAIVTDVAPARAPIAPAPATSPGSRWRRVLARYLVPAPVQAPPAAASDEEASAVIFMPDPDSEQVDSWWRFTPAAISRMLAVLGFRTERVTYHTQLSIGGPVELFTVVAQRARR